jgi:glycosyltransferase involved in cell wall biosynthesis
MTNRNRLRVALVSYNYGEYCVQLANALSQHAEVLLLIPDQTVALHMAKLGDSVRLFSFSNPRLRQPIQQFRSIRELYQKIDHFAPDVIHYQGAHLWFDLAFPLLHRYPRVFTIHDFKPHPGDRLSQKTPLWVEMFARRHAHELIVHTQFTRRLVLEEFPEFAEATSVIPHIQIGKTPWQSEAKEGEKLILFFGRIWEYKGLEYLVRAEPLITARVPDVRILIAGQGEDLGRYTRMMVHPERFTLDNKFISDERASDYFQSASVVVLPYIEASQSGVIPIAYTAAKPVVATMVGGLPEMVEDGRTGYLVAPRDTVQLANAVSRLLLDEPLRRRMGLNGKKKIEAECSPAIVAHKTLDVYRRAIERVARDRRRVFLKNSSAVTSRAGGGMD